MKGFFGFFTGKNEEEEEPPPPPPQPAAPMNMFANMSVKNTPSSLPELTSSYSAPAFDSASKTGVYHPPSMPQPQKQYQLPDLGTLNFGGSSSEVNAPPLAGIINQTGDVKRYPDILPPTSLSASSFQRSPQEPLGAELFTPQLRQSESTPPLASVLQLGPPIASVIQPQINQGPPLASVLNSEIQSGPPLTSTQSQGPPLASALQSEIQHRNSMPPRTQMNEFKPPLAAATSELQGNQPISNPRPVFPSIPISQIPSLTANPPKPESEHIQIKPADEIPKSNSSSNARKSSYDKPEVRSTYKPPGSFVPAVFDEVEVEIPSGSFAPPRKDPEPKIVDIEESKEPVVPKASVEQPTVQCEATEKEEDDKSEPIVVEEHEASSDEQETSEPVVDTNPVEVSATEAPVVEQDEEESPDAIEEEDDSVEKPIEAIEEEQEDQPPASLEDQIKSHQKSFDEHMSRLTTSQEEVSETQTQLQDQSNELMAKRKKAEENQNAAVEDEDYDKADELNDVIEDFDNMISVIADSLAKKSILYNDIEQEKVKIQSDYESTLGGLIVQLEEEIVSKKSDLTHFSSNRSDVIEVQQMTIQKQLEKINKKDDEIKVRQAELGEEREDLAERVEEKTEHIQAAKAEIVLKKEAIDKQIVDLRAQLEILESKSNKLGNKVSAESELLDQAREEFKNEEDALDEQNEALKIDENALKEMWMNMEKLQDTYNQENNTASDDAKSQQNHIDEMQAQKLSLQKDLEKWSRLNKKREQYSSELTQIQSDIQKKSRDLAEIEERYRTLLAETDDMKTKHEELTERITKIGKIIPKLDEEKKQAAAVKNFKEAGRLNTEIKSLTTESDTGNEEIENLQGQVDENDMTLKKIWSGKIELETEVSVLKKMEVVVKNMLLGQGEEEKIEEQQLD